MDHGDVRARANKVAWMFLIAMAVAVIGLVLRAVVSSPSKRVLGHLERLERIQRESAH